MTALQHNKAVALAIGKKVKARRLETEQSIVGLAEALGIDPSAFEANERGEHDFTAEQIVTLSIALRVQPSWFFEGLIERLSTTNGLVRDQQS